MKAAVSLTSLSTGALHVSARISNPPSWMANLLEMATLCLLLSVSQNVATRPTLLESPACTIGRMDVNKYLKS